MRASSTLPLPGGHFAAQRFDIRNTTRQALPRQNRQFALGDIEPTAMFGRKMPLKPLFETMRFFRRKSLVQKMRLVRTQVIAHQHNFLGVGVHRIGQIRQTLGDIHAAMLVADAHAACSGERFLPEQQAGTAVLLVLVVLPNGLFGLRGQVRAGRTVPFLARLVKANDRIVRIIRPLINGQHVFHFAHVLRRGLANAPRLDAPGLDFVFFSVTRTVSAERRFV